jgi:hypothetical protein
MSERTPSQWEELAAADPAHSTWYVERFRTMAAEGKDIFGEARLVDAMLGRGGRVLDAWVAICTRPGTSWSVSMSIRC